jgi:hypothetical protein
VTNGRGLGVATVGWAVIGLLVLAVGTLAQVVTAWLGSVASRGLAAATGSLPAAWPRRARRAPVLPIPLDPTAEVRPSRPRQSRAPPVGIAVPISL